MAVAVPRVPKRHVSEALGDPGSRAMAPRRAAGELLTSTSPRGAREAGEHSAQCAVSFGPSLEALGAEDELRGLEAWWTRGAESAELSDLLQAVTQGGGSFAIEGDDAVRSTLVSSFANLGLDAEKQDMVRYVVKEGDTVWDVCVRNQIDVQALLAVNPRLGNSPSDLAVGEVLRLPDSDWVPPEDPSVAAQREAEQFLREQEEEARREAMLRAERDEEITSLATSTSRLHVIDEDGADEGEAVTVAEDAEGATGPQAGGGAATAAHGHQRKLKRGERRTFRRMHGAAEDEARVSSLKSGGVQKVQGAPLVSGAPPDSSNAAAKEERKYSVEAGDTIFRIARQHGVSVDALVEANRGLLGHSSAPLILEHDVLVIPEAKNLLQFQAEKQQRAKEEAMAAEAKGEAQKPKRRPKKAAMTLTAGGNVSAVVNVQQVSSKTTTASLPAGTSQPAGPQAIQQVQAVTVQKGECLHAISRAHGVSVESLREFNGIQGDRIIVGQMLLLPPAAPSSSTSSSAAPTTLPASALSLSPMKKVEVRPSPVRRRDLPPSSPQQHQHRETTSPAGRKVSTVLVRRGDTLAAIATRHATTVGALRKANSKLTGDDLFEGETLVLPPQDEPDENGETSVAVDGPQRKSRSRKKAQGGGQSLKLVWDEKSGIDPEGAAARQHYLAKPAKPISGVSAEVDEVTGAVTYCMHALGSPSQSDRSAGGHGTVVYTNEKTRNAMDLAMPIDDGDGHSWVSSKFGWRWGRFHEGLDVAAYLGTPITSADAGRVSYATYEPGYGNIIEVEHRGGYVTRYAHCHELMASVGQIVAKGETIASVGQSGSATGPHLHFEVRKGGTALNPSAFIAGLQCHVDD